MFGTCSVYFVRIIDIISDHDFQIPKRYDKLISKLSEINFIVELYHLLSRICA